MLGLKAAYSATIIKTDYQNSRTNRWIFIFLAVLQRKNNYVKTPRHLYRLWKNAEVCSLQNSAVPINLCIFPEMRSADKSISK